MSEKPLPGSTELFLNILVVCIGVPLVALLAGLIAWPAVWIWRSVLGL